MYRLIGERAWQHGTTENLSDTGAVIRGVSPLPSDAATLDVVIALPSTATPIGGCLIGKGHVVRRLASSSGTREPVFAITFDQFRLERLACVVDSATIL